MPSRAVNTFDYNMVDVRRLVEAYQVLKPTGQGRRGLGHITRSAIVTLSACWEQYIEDLIIESVELIKNQATSPVDLPLPARKVISRRVKDAKHELKPLELAGNGWQDLYLAFARADVGNLHSPKSENINRLMSDYLGTNLPIWEMWGCSRDDLDSFVGFRNSIAHKGRAMEKYIKYWEVGFSISLILTTVVETDNALSDHLAEILPSGRPWNRRHL